jgi:hypothetical protein
VVFKCYFDGANQADSSQYDVVSLAVVSGGVGQWKAFEEDWKKALKRHDAPWLHTTDAVSLNGPFASEKGWDRARRDEFLSDCVTVINSHAAKSGVREGLVPHVITISLKDFLRARETNPELPKDVTEICATQAAGFALRQGFTYEAHFFHFYFDQNESFRKHIEQRKLNKKANAHLKQINDRIIHIGGSDMRHVPALQMADLFAWCVSYQYRKPRYKWQNRILDHNNFEWFDYDKLLAVRSDFPDMVKQVRSWGLPNTTSTK